MTRPYPASETISQGKSVISLFFFFNFLFSFSVHSFLYICLFSFINIASYISLIGSYVNEVKMSLNMEAMLMEFDQRDQILDCSLEAGEKVQQKRVQKQGLLCLMHCFCWLAPINHLQQTNNSNWKRWHGVIDLRGSSYKIETITSSMTGLITYVYYCRKSEFSLFLFI